MKVAVIGAGAAGLVTARELGRAAHEVSLFEQSESIGGLWKYDEAVDQDPLSRDPKLTRATSSLYRSLRTNLPRDLMCFGDYPFPGQPRFPGHAEVLGYLRDFAEHHQIERYLRLGHRLSALRPVLASGQDWQRGREAGELTGVRWRLHFERNGTPTAPEIFDAVAVCNGHYSVPRLPPLAGLEHFPGRLLHSRNYRGPEGYTSATVLILGGGASAADLSLELISAGATVHVSCRGGPDGRAFFPGAQVHAPLLEVESDGALHFADASRMPSTDVLLLCTGYRHDFPFLPKSPQLVTVEDGRVHPLYLDLVVADLPSLAFVGLPFMIVPFPLFELQARWFARLLAGRVTLPASSEREAWVAEKERRLELRGVSSRHYFRYGDYQLEYSDELSLQCGSLPLPREWRELHFAVKSARAEHPKDYRDLPLATPLTHDLS